MERYDYLILGAGPAGLSIANLIKRNWPEKRILVLEKEEEAGASSSFVHEFRNYILPFFVACSWKSSLCAAISRLSESGTPASPSMSQYISPG